MKHVLLVLTAAVVTAFVSTLHAQPNYSGVSSCQGCHSSTSIGGDQYPRWLQTGHAKAYDSLAFIQNNPVCLPCHTTGWDTLLANGGFDDYFTAGDQAGKDKTKNVQCEACHGPVALGVNHGDPETVNAEASQCGTCHEGEHHPYYSEWQQAAHSHSDTSFYSAFLTGLFRNDPNCSGCHTHQGFKEFLAEGGNIPDVANPPGDDALPLVCASCHEPHGNSNPGGLRLPVTQICAKCHNPEYPPDSVDSVLGNEVHNSTAYMLEGIGGYEYAGYAPGYPNSAHTFVATEKCVDCHVSTSPFQAGPPVIAASTGHTFMPEKRSCADAGCHATTIDTTQSEDVVFNYKNRQHECDSIAAVLAGKLAQATPADSATDDFKRAIFNYQFYGSDGSRGVHNTAYAKALLESAILNFTPSTGVEPVEGLLPRVYELGQNYPNPFNPSTVITFALPERGQVRLSVYSIDGKLVNTLVNTEMQQGTYRVPWNGVDMSGARASSGLYFYRIEAGTFTAVRKMLLLK
jgi:predicted CXXCH cytochrome family protein